MAFETTTAEVLSRPTPALPLLAKLGIDPAWAVAIWPRAALYDEQYPCQHQCPSSAIEENCGRYFWECRRCGRWRLLSEDDENLDDFTNCIGAPFEVTVAAACGVSWGDYYFDKEQEQLALLSEAERLACETAKAARDAAETAAGLARYEAEKAAAEMETRARLIREMRNKGCELRRVFDRATGQPVQCKWAFEPAGHGWPAGCADHRTHSCPFFHPNEPEWNVSIPASAASYADTREFLRRAPPAIPAGRMDRAPRGERTTQRRR